MHKKRGIVLSVATLFVVCIFLTYRCYSVVMKNIINTETQLFLRDVSSTMVDYAGTAIKSHMQMLESMALLLSDYAYDDMGMILRQPEAHADGFEYYGIVLLDGTVWCYGDASVGSDWSGIYSSDFLNRAILGQTSISEAILDTASGGLVNLYATPILSNTKLRAVLFGVRYTSSLRELLVGGLHTEGMRSHILSSTGSNISGKEVFATFEGDSMISKLNNMEILDDYTPYQIKLDMHYRRAGQFRFIEDDAICYVRYAPIPSTDLYVLSVIPSRLVDARFGNFLRVRNLSYVLFLGIILTTVISAIVIIVAARHGMTKRHALAGAIADGVQLALMETLCDKHLTLLYHNKALLSITGFSARDIQSQFSCRLSQMVHPDDVPKLIKACNARNAPNDCIELEYRIVCKNGDYVSVHDRGARYTDARGTSYYRHTLTCAADRRRPVRDVAALTEELRLAEIRHMAEPDSVGVDVFEYLPREKVIISAAFTAKRFGAPIVIHNVPQELFDWGVIDEASIDVVVDMMARVDRGEETITENIEMILPNQSRRWYNVTFTNLFGYDGKPQRAIATMVDITKDDSEGLPLDKP